MRTSVARKLAVRIKETVEDLNRQWTPFGTFFIISLVLASVLANFIQIGQGLPTDVTVQIPVVGLAVAVILVVAALTTIAVQINTSPGVIYKRAGITPLTDILIDRRRGELYFGNLRNVLMRIETIRHVLHSVAGFSDDADQTRRRLYRIGKQIGKDFADDFYDASNEARESQNLIDIIDAWCVYDVEAGWGKFILEPGSTEYTGTIVVRSNFLIAPIDDHAHEGSLVKHEASVCGFLEGYISGILEVFVRILQPTTDWSADVSENICGLTRARDSCHFVFNIERIASDDDLA